MLGLSPGVRGTTRVGSTSGRVLEETGRRYDVVMTISVLVVEDQADIRDAVKELLEGEGYVVHCAVDADEAIDLLALLPRPCLLLWDAMTPRQSLTMVDQATLEGVHVAALPVSVATVHEAGSLRTITKRLTSESAILSILEEHCPLPEQESA